MGGDVVWGCNWCINWGWKIPLRAFVGDKSWEIARTYKAVNYHINGVEQHLYSLWMSSTVEGINITYMQIAHLPYQSLLPGMDEDELIGLLKHKITLLIFPTSNRSPSPPFRINFTVSVTEKVETNKKLPPMAVPVHPPCNPSTRPCHRQPTLWWSKQFSWIGNTSSFTCQYIINLVVEKAWIEKDALCIYIGLG